MLSDSWGQATAAPRKLARPALARPFAAPHWTHLPIIMVRLSSGNSKSEHPSLPAIINLPNNWGASMLLLALSQPSDETQEFPRRPGTAFSRSMVVQLLSRRAAAAAASASAEVPPV